jgi:hypothetical protein
MLFEPEAQALLFDLIEARDLLVTRRSLIEYHGAPGEQLLASGLLEHADHETSVIASDEDESPIYTVVQDGRHGQLGYHSAIRGWVPVQQEALERYRLRVDEVFSMLLGDELRRPLKGITEIEAGYVWEVGKVRLIKTQLTSVWFARRLSDPAVQERLRSANARQPEQAHRLILTSTPHDRLPRSIRLEGSTVLPILDVLDPYAPVRIDVGRLRARFGGKASAVGNEPLHLSDDGSTLTILGTEIVFGGSHQRKAIRLIVDAHHAGKRVNAAGTLASAGYGSSVRTFPQAFRKQWPLLRPYLRSRDKLWQFEL